MSFLANRNVQIFNSTMSVSTLNTSAMAISTLTGSTLNASTINVSTLSGSTLTASTMTGNAITVSTLTVSTINGSTSNLSTLNTGNANVSTLTVSTINGSTSNLSTLNTGNANVSTLTVSTINGSTINVSTLNPSNSNVSTLTASTLSVSTMTGSTLTISRLTGLIMSASSMTSSDLVLSTLTVSSINGLPPGTGSGGSGGTTIFSTLGVSSLNARSTITTSTLIATASVGIGSTAPNAPLDVAGQIRTATTATNCIVAMTSGNGSFGSIESFNLGNTSKLPIALNAYGGNIGIGKTNPSQILDVAGAINCTSFLVNGTAVATGSGSVWGVNGSSAYYTSGSVGIGTITPSQRLHVVGDGARIMAESNTGYNAVVQMKTNANTSYLFTDQNGTLQMYADTGKNVAFMNSNNVGIGITNPSVPLHVNGMTYIQGPTVATTTTNVVGNFGLRISQLTSIQLSVGQIVGQMCFHGWTRPYASAFIRCITDATNGYDDAGALVFGTSNGGTGAVETVRITENGYVGIGTASPSHPLQVAGAINCTSFLVNGTAVATGTGSVWGVSGSIAYYTSGNVGISTTAAITNLHVRVPTYSTPVFIVDAGGQGTDTTPPRGIGKPLIGVGAYSWSNVSSGDYYGIGFGYNANNNAASYYPGEIGFLIQNTGGGEYGDMVFSTRPTTTNTTIATERMRITSAGNIGIGTVSPAAPLHIVGSTSVYGSNGTLQITNTSTTPNGCLTITSPNMINGQVMEYSMGLSATNYNMFWIAFNYISSGNTSNYTQFNHWGSGTGLVITAACNVGIGTTSPGSKLHVYSTTANDGIMFQNAYNTSTGSIGLYTSTAAGNYILDGTADAGIILPTAGKDLYLNRTTSLYTSMVVKGGTGYVGIGTATPISLLHVAGNIYSSTNISAPSISGSYYAGGDQRGVTNYFKPNSQPGGTFTVGFYGGAASGGWADGIQLNTYSDGTGGSQNLVLFQKNGIAMRIYQGGWQSSSSYSTYADVSFQAGSDIRLKENIQDVSDARGMIDMLHPKTFYFIKDEKKIRQIGFIAQEVRDYYPQFVTGTESETQYLSMEYGKMSPIAIAACKDLYVENDALRARIDILESRLAALERLLK